MAKILEKAGVDALHVDTGCYEEWYQAITTVYSKPGHKLDVQKAIKEVVSVPVLGDGKLFDPDLASKAVSSGILDYVGLGHEMLADPHWANKVKKGQIDDIRPCVGCNECLLAGFSGKHYYCAVNPTCYAEKEYALPTGGDTNRKVLVIGGGPGGMEAAITARRRGYQVDLWEKSDKLGGMLYPAGGPEFKKDVLKLVTYLENQCTKLNVNVVLNKEATADNINDLDYDRIILATGASAAMPPIEGIEKAKLAIDYLTDQVEVGDNVVIIGGGLAGTEAACAISQSGKKATIVEMLPDVLAIANHCLNNDQHLRNMLKECKVEVIGDAKVTKITDNTLVYQKDGNEYTLTCDTVLNAAGFKPNNQLEDLLEAKYDDKVVVIGDAVSPRKILTAVHEGYHAIRVME